MPRMLREVVFVDGVRTPFGKAGPGGLYAQTRADDLVVSCIRELIRRSPQLAPERVDEVAIAATTQAGDQGLTIGRTAALLAGLPASVPGYAIDRMCAGAMTAVTTTASGIAFGAYDVAIAATTQTGDQGLTIGRTASLLAGLPQSVPGYAIDRMCAGAMTAVTSVAGGIAFGAYDIAIAGGVEHMGRHPMGEGVDPNPRIISRMQLTARSSARVWA